MDIPLPADPNSPGLLPAAATGAQTFPEPAPPPAPAMGVPPADAPYTGPPPAAMEGYPLDDGHVRRGAGVALILSAGGMAAGGLLGGPAGAFAGLSLVGATRNILRAHKLWRSPVHEERIEAGHSGVMAVIGFTLSGYLSYRAYQNHYGIKELT